MDLKLSLLRKELKKFRKTQMRLSDLIFVLIELTKLSVSYPQPREVD